MRDAGVALDERTMNKPSHPAQIEARPCHSGTGKYTKRKPWPWWEMQETMQAARANGNARTKMTASPNPRLDFYDETFSRFL